MLPVIWRASARQDVREIVLYIAQNNPAAARRMKKLFESSVLPAATFPYMYRQSKRIPGLREIVAHPNYIILYRVTEKRIEVVNVIHARRQWPPA